VTQIEEVYIACRNAWFAAVTSHGSRVAAATALAPCADSAAWSRAASGSRGSDGAICSR
jgi:hypothetical protein